MGQKERQELLKPHLHLKQIGNIGILSALLVLAFELMLTSCANQTSIQGGPRDTIPPVLVQSVPRDNTLNYKGNIIQLEFNEKMQARSLKESLIITPTMESEYEYQVKKNVITLTFEEPFEDSTTYIFNFADGVGDLSENNNPINLSIAFSTTSYIDSLYIKGKVYDLLKNEPAENMLVGLYDNDTLDVFKHAPSYFAYTDEEGLFQIRNLKRNKYRLYTFNDDNKNLTLNSDTEAHGFYPDTINLTDSLVDIEIPIVLMNAQPVELIRARSNGNYFDAIYSKTISEYQLIQLDSPVTHQFLHHLTDESKAFRIYNSTLPLSDSVSYMVTAYDSLGNYTVDTLLVKFQKPRTTISPFTLIKEPGKKQEIKDTLILNYQVNEPVASINLDSAYMLIDTLGIEMDPNLFNFIFANSYTDINVIVQNPTAFLEMKIDSMKSLMPDSTALVDDSVAMTKKKYLDRLKAREYQMIFGSGFFVTIENDSSATLRYDLSEPRQIETGLVRGNIETNHTSYWVQLITNDLKIIQTIRNPGNTYQFSKIPPGNYSIRVKIDDNKDGKWSYGNIRKMEPPESQWYMESTFEVRPNWELEDIDLKF